MIARLIPSTVRGRLTLTYGALSFVLILGVGTFLIFSVRGRYEGRLENQLAEQARMAGSAIAAKMAADPASPVLEATIDQLGSGIETRLAIVDPSGRVVADSGGDPAALPNEANRSDTSKAIARSTDGDESPVRSTRGGQMYVAVPVPGVPGAVARASISLAEIDDAVERFQRNVLATALVVSWITLIVAIYVAGRITGPLKDLRRHAVLVAGGQLDTTVMPASTRELGDLARAFNTMTRRIRDLVDESERSRSRLEAIFANLGDGVIIVDATSTVIGINAAAGAMLGTRLNMAMGQPFVVVVRDADFHRLLRRAFESGGQQTATIEYGRTGRVFDAVAQPVERSGERLGIVVVRDVTELRRLETVRREFVANVSHELRTPLASIRALVETLEAGAIDDPEVSGDFLGRVVGEVDRLTALVDELLDLARLESGRLALRIEPMSPAVLITAGVDRLRPQVERAQLELLCEIDPDLPRVAVDRIRIEQVLLNLIHNAIKFTRPGGKITVTARPKELFVEVSVTDTGVGIPPAELARVFERFYKSDKARRSDGTGLGLAIAKHIVQTHGGSIWAESTLGEGASFFFTLPRVESEPGQRLAAPADVLTRS